MTYTKSAKSMIVASLLGLAIGAFINSPLIVGIGVGGFFASIVLGEK